MPYLSHSSEESLSVEESSHPESVGTTIEAPGVELCVAVNQLREPETQGTGVPRDLYIIIIKVFVKRKILSIGTILSTHTRAPAHTSILTIQSLIYSSIEQKTWQGYSFGKKNVFRLHLIESREGFCQRGRGRSFHVDGLKTEKAHIATHTHTHTDN